MIASSALKLVTTSICVQGQVSHWILNVALFFRQVESASNVKNMYQKFAHTTADDDKVLSV